MVNRKLSACCASPASQPATIDLDSGTGHSSVGARALSCVCAAYASNKPHRNSRRCIGVPIGGLHFAEIQDCR